MENTMELQYDCIMPQMKYCITYKDSFPHTHQFVMETLLLVLAFPPGMMKSTTAAPGIALATGLVKVVVNDRKAPIPGQQLSSPVLSDIPSSFHHIVKNKFHIQRGAYFPGKGEEFLLCSSNNLMC